MTTNSKVFTYEVEGLSYIVTVYEEGGSVFADITVNEGAMDVNAIYFGDNDQSGTTESLDGPLNLSGARLDGEKIQWDDANAISDPGLGSEGTDKETYLTEGDTLTVSLDATSLDDIDILGLRATSTSTEEGSIKAVSGDPEVVGADAEYASVFFGEVFSDTGEPVGGTFILDDAPVPNEFNVPALPDGVDPTFENYLNYFDSDAFFDPVSDVTSVVLYEQESDGGITEAFRIDAPEGGWANSEELLAAYDDAIAEMEETAPMSEGEALIAALSFAPDADDLAGDDAAAQDDIVDDII